MFSHYAFYTRFRRRVRYFLPIGDNTANQLRASIRNLMENVGWTAQQAMDALKIPASEQDKYAALI